MAKKTDVTTDETVEEVKEVKEPKSMKIVCMRTGVVQEVDAKSAKILLDRGLYITMKEAEEKEASEERKLSDGTVIKWWEIHRNPIVISKGKDWKPILVNS